jgi:GGDEF domain-containing protein
LVSAQRLYAERDADTALSPYAFQSGAERLLAHAIRRKEDLALLSLSIDTSAAQLDQVLAGLRRAIRQTDLLACTGNNEFSVATASLDAAASRAFAGRLCDAARAVSGDGSSTVCCGVATLADSAAEPALHELWDAARRRSQAGRARGRSGAIGAAEESAFVAE